MQFLGPHVDVAEHDVVGDDVLDKGAPVVLLLIVALGPVEGHACHGADRASDLVLAHGEDGVVEPGAQAAEGVEGPAVHGSDGPVRPVEHAHVFRPLPADEAQVTAGDHGTLGVDDADDPVCGFFDLQDNVLKDPS